MKEIIDNSNNWINENERLIKELFLKTNMDEYINKANKIMKKIIFTLAIVCAMMTSCSSKKTTVVESDTDSVVEMVDSVSIDTIVEDSVL